MSFCPYGQQFFLIGSVFLTAVSAVGCTDGDGLPVKRTDDASAMGSPRDDASVKVNTPLDAGSVVSLDASSATQFSPLIDNQLWRRYDAAADPLPSHQPAESVCPIRATYLEYGSFEVDTTRCNYVLSETPALFAVAAGADVKMELLHYDLTAPGPAEAHIALFFGDALQWETTLPIPKAGDVVKARFQATSALAPDEPIRLHLHNHGGNSYLVVSIQAQQ
jgi:hypothetical protein